MKVLRFAVFSLFVAASPGLADQQISGPTLPSSIPPVDLFRLLISDYDQRMRQWEAKKGSEDEMWYRFDIRLSERVETDFGLGRKHYLVAALEGTTGACTQCYLLVIGVVDPDSKEVLWRFGDESIGGPAKVSLRRVFPSPGALALTFQHLEGSTNWGFVRTETWIQPVTDEGGRLSFREIWSHAIEVSNAGNHGGGLEHSCGWMASGSKDGELLFHQSAFYAEPNPCVGDDDADSIWAKLPCSERLAAYRKCSTVEIERFERWVVEGDGLKRVSVKSSRIDHAESEIFLLICRFDLLSIAVGAIQYRSLLTRIRHACFSLLTGNICWNSRSPAVALKSRSFGEADI